MTVTRAEPEIGSLAYYGVKSSDKQFEHAGIKGMKWGHRKAQESSGGSGRSGGLSRPLGAVRRGAASASTGQKVALGAATAGAMLLARRYTGLRSSVIVAAGGATAAAVLSRYGKTPVIETPRQ